MRLHLPKNKKALVQALDVMEAGAIQERAAKRVEWTTTKAYLEDVRIFNLLDYQTGEVVWEWGELHDNESLQYNGVPFRYPDAVTKIHKEIGRLSSMDVYPSVKKRIGSLQSMRDAAYAQATLDALIQREDKRKIDIGFFCHLVMFGTAALACWEGNNSSDPFSYELDLIPPWELLFIPHNNSNPGEDCAITRERLVPIKTLEDWGFAIPKDRVSLEPVDMPHGYASTVEASTQWDVGDPFTSRWGQLFGQMEGNEKSNEELESYVLFKETWVKGPKGTLAQYIARAGTKILQNDYYSVDDNVAYPIGVARYIDTAGAYGRSFAGLCIPAAMRMEHCMKVLIEYLEDMDRFGFTLIPNTYGISQDDFRKGTRNRIITYERDLTASGDPAQHIAPTTSGTFPIEVLNTLVAMTDKLTSQGEAMSGGAPGRVDSGAGLATLAELSTTHLALTADSVEQAYSTVYKCMLQRAKVGLQQAGAEGKAVDLIRISNDMAGLEIGQDGKVKLVADKLPDPWTVDVSIKSKDPMRLEKRREEAVAFLDRGILTPLEFIIMNYREGWDFPIGQKGIWENYVKAEMANLLLYNDGETPGTVTMNMEVDNPAVHIYALNDFMGTVQWELASDAVKQKMADRLMDVKAWMGQATPQGMPTPDGAAMEQQLTTMGQMRAAKQGMGGGASPGMQMAM